MLYLSELTILSITTGSETKILSEKSPFLKETDQTTTRTINYSKPQNRTTTSQAHYLGHKKAWL
ncbi:hypothetical protein phiMH2Kp04 [Bdellovibrio phage phiMH2K]|uniref:Uncharacterized protein Y n=1 Tax=Bdellovibrio phage phiMH2K TaxID=145579 RepID=Y_BPPHM|nr:hypothetical protein phiMH2Kp04 [Bdellovibrio phage phiMH2K]Q9G057.1 RecName: Full=Uncharacterized protein Y [Bdellovibrio phage phiMH2K]AAG45342.1 OrfY [Bdellovibrio phage phiMH2K]